MYKTKKGDIERLSKFHNNLLSQHKQSVRPFLVTSSPILQVTVSTVSILFRFGAVDCLEIVGIGCSLYIFIVSFMFSGSLK